MPAAAPFSRLLAKQCHAFTLNALHRLCFCQALFYAFGQQGERMAGKVAPARFQPQSAEHLFEDAASA